GCKQSRSRREYLPVSLPLEFQLADYLCLRSLTVDRNLLRRALVAASGPELRPQGATRLIQGKLMASQRCTSWGSNAVIRRCKANAVQTRLSTFRGTRSTSLAAALVYNVRISLCP